MQEIKQMGDYCPECTALAAQGVWEDGTHHYRHNGKHELTIECRPLPPAPPEDALEDAKALEDAIQQLTFDADISEALGDSHSKAFAADLRTVIAAAKKLAERDIRDEALKHPLVEALTDLRRRMLKGNGLVGTDLKIIDAAVKAVIEREQYAAKILESERPEIERKAVERFIEKVDVEMRTTSGFNVNRIEAVELMRAVAKEMNGEPKKCA